MLNKYKKWLEYNFNNNNLDVDEVGQINFIGTPFENDQDARLKIQAIFDEAYGGSKMALNWKDNCDICLKDIAGPGEIHIAGSICLGHSWFEYLVLKIKLKLKGGE